MRRTAKLLGVSYMTVYQKFLWLSAEAKAHHQNQRFNASEIQFDETLSIEHTKLKPLSIAIAVSKEPNHKYKILDIKVATIPAFGRLAHISRAKYGPRADESSLKIKELLTQVKSQLKAMPYCIKSDQKPSYKNIVNEVFKGVPYSQYLSRGNKEKRREMKYSALEKSVFDPLFAINHKCACLRNDIKRFARRSWCTTKIKDHLERHIYLYIAYNNQYDFC